MPLNYFAVNYLLSSCTYTKCAICTFYLTKIRAYNTFSSKIKQLDPSHTKFVQYLFNSWETVSSQVHDWIALKNTMLHCEAIEFYFHCNWRLVFRPFIYKLKWFLFMLFDRKFSSTVRDCITDTFANEKCDQFQIPEWWIIKEKTQRNCYSIIEFKSHKRNQCGLWCIRVRVQWAVVNMRACMLKAQNAKILFHTNHRVGLITNINDMNFMCLCAYVCTRLVWYAARDCLNMIISTHVHLCYK